MILGTAPRSRGQRLSHRITFQHKQAFGHKITWPYQYTSYLRGTTAGVVLPKVAVVGLVTVCANQKSWLKSQRLQRLIQ